MRIIIYIGKDGVGKTTVASMTAVKLAKQGLRTLIMSSDETNSLSYIFSSKIGSQPTQIDESLWALEYHKITDDNWNEIHNWLRRIMKWKRLYGVSTDEIAIIPGIKQLLFILEMKQYFNHYDVIILDSRLMNEVLRLLSYHELIEVWINKLFKSERYLLKVVRPLTKVVSIGFEVPNKKVILSGEVLMNEILDLQKILLNQKITSFRLVLDYDDFTISKARRNFTYLNMFGFHIDSIMVNKQLPSEVMTGYFSNWYQKQLINSKEILDSFNPLPIFHIPFMDKPIQGINNLEKIGCDILSEVDVYSILYEGKIQQINDKELKIIIPHYNSDCIQYIYNQQELTIQIESYSRIIFLPYILMKKTMDEAYFEDNILTIKFKD